VVLEWFLSELLSDLVLCLSVYLCSQRTRFDFCSKSLIMFFKDV